MRGAHRTAVVAALAFGLAGCLPWALGETAETLPRGRVSGGVGVSGLMPPLELDEAFPVPQAWCSVGLGGVDARADYAFPLTFRGGLKVALPHPEGWAVAATAGGGIHGLPNVAGGKARNVRSDIRLFFADAGLVVSGPGKLRPYGAVRATLPFVLGDQPAATLWSSAVVGIELGRGRLRWGPELGVVVPATHPGDALVQLGISLRWR
ncbi:MAG: hypothetical protein P8099_06280 [Gemmatimonadota bacterium]|jgi:hypothetical protein